MKSHFLAFGLSALMALPAIASDLVAIDGDTVKLGAEHIRIIGLDAPELHEPKCEAERQLAERARERMATLIAVDGIEIIRGGRPDKYGRTLAVIRAGGVDVARIMISEGLARPYHGERRDGWCGYPVPRRRPE